MTGVCVKSFERHARRRRTGESLYRCRVNHPFVYEGRDIPDPRSTSATAPHHPLVRSIACQAAALLIAGCGAHIDGEGDFTTHVVQPIEQHYVELRLYGLAANSEPDSYRTTLDWHPLEKVAPEGVEVKPGEPLFALNTKVAQIQTDEHDLEIDIQLAQQNLTEITTAKQVQELDAKRMDYEQNRQILDARIAATHRKDQAELQVAEMQLDRAIDKRDRAKSRLDRLRSLKDKHIANLRDLRQAEHQYRRAFQEARIPGAELESLQTASYTVSRRLLQLDLNAVTLDLGDEQHADGVFGQIAALRRKQRLQAMVTANELDKLRRHRARYKRVVEDGTVRAEVAGVVRHREGGLRVGDRLRPSSAVFVLRDQDMGFTFELPARWRNLITVATSDDPGSGHVDVDVPQLGATNLPGRVQSVSAMPYRGRHGQAYRCFVVLHEPLTALREGMQVDCALRVAVPGDALRIPGWTISDPRDPAVIMANGTRRRVEGRMVGRDFIVHGGLQPGERIRARARVARATVRLGGLVGARDAVILRVPWRVEIVEMIADGSAVEAGEIVATIVRLRHDRTRNFRDEAAVIRDKAAAKLAIDQIEAEADLAKSYVKWRQAVLAVQQARLRHVIARYGSYEQEQTTADVAREQARLDLAAARQRLAAVEDPAATETVSVQQVRGARLAKNRAELALAKADLGAAATMRAREWLHVWDEHAKSYDAEQLALTMRDAYSLQRETFHLALARAADKHQLAMDESRRLIERVEQLTVRAPFGGHVYYNFDDWGGHKDYRPLKIGRRLRTTRPFYMPVDNQRVVRLEAPASFHGRFDVGDELPVHLSVLGSQPVTGTITSLSRHFHISELSADEYITRGTVGVPERIFTICIALKLTDQQTALVKPGVTAWVEVPR